MKISNKSKSLVVTGLAFFMPISTQQDILPDIQQ